MRRSKQRKLIWFDELRQSVIDHISDGWSPQQIAGRMRLERHPISVSHETIYQFVYSADGHQEGLWKDRPERRAKPRPRYARRVTGVDFHQNSASYIARTWSPDVSRFTVLLRNNDRQSKPVMEGVFRTLQPLPQIARRSITFDRGTEFTEWAYLQAGIGSQTWFCDPQSPWQKGTAENNNRRARRWLPRDLDPLTLSDRDHAYICNRLNNTPRKCVGYKTPVEVFRQKLIANKNRYA